MKNKQKIKISKKKARARRIRAKVSGHAKRPRATVYRSLKHINVQLIDDQKGKTLASASDRGLKIKDKMKKVEIAKLVGQALAAKAIKLNIKEVVFDRKGLKYHGRIKALADGMREKGLKF